VIIRTLHACFEQAALPRLFVGVASWVAQGLQRLARLPPQVWIGVWAAHVAFWLVILAFRDAATLGLCVNR